VLKPAEGSGSRGMYSVASAGELTALLEGDAAGSDCVVEEYVRDNPRRDQRFASYLSVESVISQGRVSHVAITGRFPLAEPFRETGNFIPAVVEPDLRPVVLGMASEAIEALGITTAVIHTEIKLSPDGPKLIEVNGRLGGRPPFVLQSVSDVNLFQVACQVAAGMPVSFDGPVDCREIGFWLMLQPPMPARQVTAIQGAEDLSGLDGIDVVSVNRRPGDAVDWREGTDAQVMTVRGRAPDYQALADMVELIRHKVTIDYDH
jgi:biotin carboxylase